MKFMVALCILLSGTAFAQLRCIDKLLPTGKTSVAYQLLQTEWRPTNPGPISNPDVARSLNTLVFSKLLCRADEIEFDLSISCLPLDSHKPEWVVCQNNSSLGHFVLTSDLSQNMNIIFHKAPRPPELPAESQTTEL